MTQRTVFNDPDRGVVKYPSRRTVLKSAAAAPLAGAPALAAASRRAGATTVGGIMATGFPGNSYARNAGTIQGFPTSNCADLFISYWYNSSVISPLNHSVLSQKISTDSSSIIQVSHLSNSKRNTGYLAAGVVTVGGGISGQSRVGSLLFDGRWHQVMIQVNTATGLILAYLDGIPIPGWVRTSFHGPAYIPFYTLSGNPLIWDVGASETGPASPVNIYNGALAELYVIAGTPVPVTDANYRAAFTDPVTGFPRRAGDHPAVVDTSGGGINVLQTLYPQIHLWGPPGQFLLNQPNWTRPTWDWNNPPTAMIDNGPNQFYVATGALTTPSSDPWGFTGEV